MLNFRNCWHSIIKTCVATEVCILSYTRFPQARHYYSYCSNVVFQAQSGADRLRGRRSANQTLPSERRTYHKVKSVIFKRLNNHIARTLLLIAKMPSSNISTLRLLSLLNTIFLC